MTEHYDVIIVGSGAGGGTLARTMYVVDTSLIPLDEHLLGRTS